MQISVSHNNIIVERTDSDVNGESWFDAMDEQLILIRNKSVTMYLMRFESYELAFKTSNILNDMWESMEVEEVILIHDNKIKLLSKKKLKYKGSSRV